MKTNYTITKAAEIISVALVGAGIAADGWTMQIISAAPVAMSGCSSAAKSAIERMPGASSSSSPTSTAIAGTASSRCDQSACQMVA